MSFVLSFVGILTSILFVYLSFQTTDEVFAQVNRILSASILLISFFFSPFFLKLVMVLALMVIWPYLVERLSLSFHHRLNK